MRITLQVMLKVVIAFVAGCIAFALAFPTSQRLFIAAESARNTTGDGQLLLEIYWGSVYIGCAALVVTFILLLRWLLVHKKAPQSETANKQ
jgi:hypothetical protein